jgi:hypothetical protein
LDKKILIFQLQPDTNVETINNFLLFFDVINTLHGDSVNSTLMDCDDLD